MYKVYVYILDTLADWEIGYVTAELNSGRFFKQGQQPIPIKTLSNSKEAIKTMGGLSLVPDYIIDDMVIDKNTVLILPGANTWSDSKHSTIINKAHELLESGGTVCAICGATVALANSGLFNNRLHTSNALAFLEQFCPNYQGQDFYVDQPSVSNSNLITASFTGALLWTKQILKHLDVFQPTSLEAWYQYFSTGDANHFFALMQSLENVGE